MQNNEPDQSVARVATPVAMLAWTLIVGGVIIAIYVLDQLLTVYFDSDGSSFVGVLSQRFTDKTLMTFGDIPLEVTEYGATVLAYFVFVPLALLGIHIAVALIRAGAQILSPTFPYQISRIKQRLENLREKVEK